MMGMFIVPIIEYVIYGNTVIMFMVNTHINNFVFSPMPTHAEEAF